MLSFKTRSFEFERGDLPAYKAPLQYVGDDPCGKVMQRQMNLRYGGKLWFETTRQAFDFFWRGVDCLSAIETYVDPELHLSAIQHVGIVGWDGAMVLKIEPRHGEIPWCRPSPPNHLLERVYEISVMSFKGGGPLPFLKHFHATYLKAAAGFLVFQHGHYKYLNEMVGGYSHPRVRLAEGCPDFVGPAIVHCTSRTHVIREGVRVHTITRGGIVILDAWPGRPKSYLFDIPALSASARLKAAYAAIGDDKTITRLRDYFMALDFHADISDSYSYPDPPYRVKSRDHISPDWWWTRPATLDILEISPLTVKELIWSSGYLSSDPVIRRRLETFVSSGDQHDDLCSLESIKYS